MSVNVVRFEYQNENRWGVVRQGRNVFITRN
jgi:hypothetical protein